MNMTERVLATDATERAQLISVVVPVHNEEAAIEADLQTIFQTLEGCGYTFEVIVVDDGSTDRSADLVRNWPKVELIQHQRNRGTGAALKTGIRHCHGDIVIMTDADGTYPNQDMPRLLSLMGEYDMVVGARKQEKGTLRWLRAPAKAFIRLLASYLTATRIPDLNSGLRCFRRNLAEHFFPILPAGHSWVSTITLAFLTNGYRVGYIPIDYYQRKGKSHFRPFRDTSAYIALVLRTVMYFDPLKFFVPFASLLLIIGAGKTLADIIRYDFHIATSTVMIVLTAVQIGAIGVLADLIVKHNRLRG